MPIRVIPTLLLHNKGLVKSVKFKDYKYVGDPINAVKIFNEKEVDEIVLLDIDASRENRSPDINRISAIASEAFMPMAYGGGIKSIDEIKSLFLGGIEKIILNKASIVNPRLISEAAKIFGSQSVVVSIDVKKTIFGKYNVYTGNGKTNTKFSPTDFVKRMEILGAGEILLNSIDRDGTYVGYDNHLIEMVSQVVSIPVIASGGAGSIEDFKNAIKSGASAVAAGSMFVFHGKHRAVLINYPKLEI